MRIGVDACSWSNPRGYGRYARELLRAMVSASPDDEFVCFVDPWTEAEFDLRSGNARTVSVALHNAPSKAAAADGSRSAVDMLRLTRAVRREPLDVFFSPSVYTYFPIPLRLPAVVTIHDAIAERFPELTLPTRRARLFWHAKVRLAVWQARLILTVSEYSARDLVSVLGIAPGRIRVSSEAPGPAYRPTEDPERTRQAAAAVGLPEGARWFIYVGGFNPHKNVDVIARAHARAARENPGAPPYLLLVGAPERDVFYGNTAAIRSAIHAGGTAGLVKWTGFVPDEELRHLHSGALALLIPSACEGFGLPAVEAAACGAPVVATLESPLPQVLEGGGIFVTPGDEDDLHAALKFMLDHEAERLAMGRCARERAEALSWNRSADVAMHTLREAVR